MTGEKLPQNSGGPIHVTSLVENPLDPATRKVMINFILEHVGTGDFYGRTATETCNPIVTNLNKYKVDVEVRSEDPGTQITCAMLSGGNRGTITMYSGAPAPVTCTIIGSGGTRVYTDPVQIITRYRYGESVTQMIVLQAVGSN